jgi:hypothetical protein
MNKVMNRVTELLNGYSDMHPVSFEERNCLFGSFCDGNAIITLLISS